MLLKFSSPKLEQLEHVVDTAWRRVRKQIVDDVVHLRLEIDNMLAVSQQLELPGIARDVGRN